MQGSTAPNKISATRLTASTFGVLAGIGGITHGIGEMRQGNVSPSGIFIESWTEGPIATHMGGDPGMTLAPNLLAAGVLTLLVSLTVLVWAALFVQRKHGGWILIGLSIAMLLAGGGFGSPIIGVLAGWAGTRIGAPLTWWRRHLSTGVRQVLARLWPWLFGIATINGVFLFVGAILLVYAFGAGNSDLYLASFYFSVISLVLTTITAIAYDIQPPQHVSAT